MEPSGLEKNISTRNSLNLLFRPDQFLSRLHGIFFISLFSLSSYHISSFEIMKSLKMSPVIIGLTLGAFYANSFGKNLPSAWMPGIIYCKHNILKIAIILYGVKLTFQDLFKVGLVGFSACFIIVLSTLVFTFLFSKYCFKLDNEISILIAAGSSICGSAAILATSSILKSKSYKNLIAIAITFLFGTLGMLLFPLVYRLGWIPINESLFGFFLGITLPSVGNVAAAGAAISETTANNAIIIKMIRVIMLVPFLLILGLFIPKKYTNKTHGKSFTIQGKRKFIIPWFSIFFIITIAMNSWLQPPLRVVSFITHVDNFLLTMAMTAFGVETSSDKIQGVGVNVIYLGFVISAWLIIISLLIVNFVV